MVRIRSCYAGRPMKETKTAAKVAGHEEARRLVELLRNLMRDAGLSARALERKLGLGSDGSTVIKFLSGAMRPSLLYLLMILTELGLTPAEFFELAYSAEGEEAV